MSNLTFNEDSGGDGIFFWDKFIFPGWTVLGREPYFSRNSGYLNLKSLLDDQKKEKINLSRKSTAIKPALVNYFIFAFMRLYSFRDSMLAKQSTGPMFETRSRVIV